MEILELKPPPLLSSDAVLYPAKNNRSTIQLYIHINENKCFMSGGICFMSLYLLIYFYLPDFVVIMTLLRYFVCCIRPTHIFQFGTASNNAQLTHPLTSGMHQSEANLLNTCGKFICVVKQRKSIPREHLPKLNVFASL